MNKQDYLVKLESLIQSINKEERTKAISYYSELIDDFMEEGCSESDAVEKVGRPGLIAEQLLFDEGASHVGKAKSIKGKIIAGVLIVLGCPLWVSLIIVCLCFVLVGILILLIGYLMLWLIPFLLCVFVFVCILIAAVGTLGSIALMEYNISLGLMQLGVGLFASGLFVVFTMIAERVIRSLRVVSKMCVHWVYDHTFKKMKGIKIW